MIFKFYAEPEGGTIALFFNLPRAINDFLFPQEGMCLFFFQKILTPGVSQGRRGEWAWLEA